MLCIVNNCIHSFVYIVLVSYRWLLCECNFFPNILIIYIFYILIKYVQIRTHPRHVAGFWEHVSHAELPCPTLMPREELDPAST